MALESYCASCTYLGERADSCGKYWCSKKGEDHYACDPKCYNWCEAYSRSTSARENMYENSRSHSGGGCYITTAMCQILGFEDNNYYLETLRGFRDNVLKKNRQYWSTLITYDFIGPAIATRLLESENKEKEAYNIFIAYIQTAVAAIEKNEIESAVEIYKNITVFW